MGKKKKKKSESVNKLTSEHLEQVVGIDLEQSSTKALNVVGGVEATKLFPSSDSLKTIAGMDLDQMKSATSLMAGIDTSKLFLVSDSLKTIAGMNLDQVKLATSFAAGIDKTKLFSASDSLKTIAGMDLDQVKSAISITAGVDTTKLFPYKSLKTLAGMDWEQIKLATSKTYNKIHGLDTSWLFAASRALKGVAGMDLDEILSNTPSYVNRLTGLTFDQERANKDFTEHLDKLHGDYDYSYKPSKDQNDSDIPVELVFEKKHPIPVEELEQGFGLLSLLENVKETQMTDFVGHLLEYPMLALEHQVGRTIRKAVKGLAKNVRITGSLYHCRTREKGTMPLTKSEMFAPPAGVSQQGRFNSTGQGFLYVSRKEETAILEMKQPVGTLYEIIEWGFDENVMMLDVTNKDLPLFRYCMFKASNNANIKKEYLVSNFLSQCCKIEKIDVVKYKSVLTPDVSNYVFFDYMDRWFNCVSQKSVTI